MDTLQSFMTLLVLGTMASILMVMQVSPTRFNMVPRSVEWSANWRTSILDTHASMSRNAKADDDFSLRELSQGIVHINQLLGHYEQKVEKTVINSQTNIGNDTTSTYYEAQEERATHVNISNQSPPISAIQTLQHRSQEERPQSPLQQSQKRPLEQQSPERQQSPQQRLHENRLQSLQQQQIQKRPQTPQDLTSQERPQSPLRQEIQERPQPPQQQQIQEPSQSPQPIEQRPQQQLKRCRPRNNIVLLKTHKTGSSTIQNILYRYGDARGLSFVLPASDVYMGSPALFLPQFAIPSSHGYNILANHARYNKASMTSIMPRDTKFITIVRHPSSQFESMYSYYGFFNKFHTSVEGFARDPKKYYSREEPAPRHSALNPVLYDLGLNKKSLSKSKEIDKKIRDVDRSFSLVLVAEHLYESLVLLKDIMCWSWDDVTFFTSNKRNNSIVRSLPVKTTKQLLEWQSGDYKLYLHFNRTLHAKIKKYGVKRMEADVEYLKSRNEALAKMCLAGTKKVSEMHGRTIIDRYVLKPGKKKDFTCKRMTYSAYDYLTILIQKQKLIRKKNL